jgi:Domain of unknown function (DUF4386)
MSTTIQAVADVPLPAPPTNHQAYAPVTRTIGQDVSLRQAALVAGLALLILAVLAPIANFGILHKLIAAGDAQTTAQNLAAAPGLFRIGIALFFLVAILDVVVAWGLYVFFQPVNRSLSLLAALFRVVYATMLGIALTNLLSALQIVGGADSLKAFGADQLQTQMMVLLGAFQSAWDLSLIIFGLHLFILGMLVFGSGRRLPMVLGVLVIAAGVGYLVDGWGTLLVPNYSLGVSTYTFVGEALLIFWLLWKGIRGVDASNHRQAKVAP